MALPNGLKRKREDLMLDAVSSKPTEMRSNDDAHRGSGGAILPDEELSGSEPGFQVNEQYARRFEHNKKREELYRCWYA